MHTIFLLPLSKKYVTYFFLDTDVSRYILVTDIFVSRKNETSIFGRRENYLVESTTTFNHKRISQIYLNLDLFRHSFVNR
jgi:hypothetical protein